MFYYKVNYQHPTIVLYDKFMEFLEAFESNPFRFNEDKKFKKELIENIIKYSHDHMSMITAAVLLKKKFTLNEIIQNYYANINAFENDLF